MKKDRSKLEQCKSDANKPKEQLMALSDKLREYDFITDADQLDKIVAKLEVWQNK